jgi:hypothetical protein
MDLLPSRPSSDNNETQVLSRELVTVHSQSGRWLIDSKCFLSNPLRQSGARDDSGFEAQPYADSRMLENLISCSRPGKGLQRGVNPTTTPLGVEQLVKLIGGAIGFR